MAEESREAFRGIGAQIPAKHAFNTSPGLYEAISQAPYVTCCYQCGRWAEAAEDGWWGKNCLHNVGASC